MGIESTARHQSRRYGHPGASAGQVCGFGQPPVEVSTTIRITTVDGAEVLVVRELTSRETGEALRVFRIMFPKSEGYVYAIDSQAAPGVSAGGDAA